MPKSILDMFHHPKNLIIAPIIFQLLLIAVVGVGLFSVTNESIVTADVPACKYSADWACQSKYNDDGDCDCNSGGNICPGESTNDCANTDVTYCSGYNVCQRFNETHGGYTADDSCTSLLATNGWYDDPNNSCKEEYREYKCSSGASDYTSTNTRNKANNTSCGGGSNTCQNGVCTAPSSCTLDGKTVASGNSDTFWRAKESTSCSSGLRLCTNGTFGPDPAFAYASCGPPATTTSCADQGYSFTSTEWTNTARAACFGTGSSNNDGSCWKCNAPTIETWFLNPDSGLTVNPGQRVWFEAKVGTVLQCTNGSADASAEFYVNGAWYGATTKYVPESGSTILSTGELHEVEAKGIPAPTIPDSYPVQCRYKVHLTIQDTGIPDRYISSPDWISCGSKTITVRNSAIIGECGGAKDRVYEWEDDLPVSTLCSSGSYINLSDPYPYNPSGSARTISWICEGQDGGTNASCSATRERQITYKVSYNGNGNTDGTAPGDQDKIHDTSLTLASNSGDLVKTGYTFSGWNTLTNGTGINYAENAIYTGNVALALHAQWTPSTYSVSYTASNGSCSPTSRSVNHGSDAA
ncbi:MAG: InlB B-repeat-containing protein, partial [bacterium]|nr:InlB B-repeat-containing protein [bacterium]